MIRHLEPIRTAWLVALLVVAPLPFGGVAPGSRTFLLFASWVALCLGVLAVPRPTMLRSLLVPALVLGGMSLLGVLQAQPWPASWVSWLSPEHARLHHASQEITGFVEVKRASLSLAPTTSLSTAGLWLGAAAAMLATALASRRRSHRHALGAAVVGMGLFEVLYGAQRWFGKARDIWGVEVPGSPDRLRGTFVNSDHLALYLEISLALTFAWGWWALRRSRNEVLWDRRLLLAGPPLLLWLGLFMGLAFTGSRAGLLAAVLATTAQGGLVAAIRRRWQVASAGILASLLGLGVIAMVALQQGLQQGLGRWMATTAYEVTFNERLTIYASCLELWTQFPILGTGLGTFREAFPLVAQGTSDTTLWHAHNDYLEVLVTTGIVGAGLLLWGLLTLLSRLQGILLHGSRSADRAAAVAALGALCAVAIHSAFDFGLTMPANALTLAAVCGAAAGASRREPVKQAG